MQYRENITYYLELLIS